MAACCFRMTEDARVQCRPGSAQDAARLRGPWRRDDEALPQIAPADDGRAAPETAELDGAVEQAGTGGDQDWPRWLRQAHRPMVV